MNADADYCNGCRRVWLQCECPDGVCIEPGCENPAYDPCVRCDEHDPGQWEQAGDCDCCGGSGGGSGAWRCYVCAGSGKAAQPERDAYEGGTW